MAPQGVTRPRVVAPPGTARGAGRPCTTTRARHCCHGFSPPGPAAVVRIGPPDSANKTGHIICAGPRGVPTRSHDCLAVKINEINLSTKLYIIMTDTNQLALELTESVSVYMWQKFQHQIHSIDLPIYIPKEWDTCLLYECNQAVDTLARAFQNQSVHFYSIQLNACS